MSNIYMSAKRPIGILDSGVGGLSVLRELIRLMPEEDYVFIADQINVPYGEKTKKELEMATLKICDFLVSKNSKIIVIACNTATCYAIDSLRSNIGVPIVGTVPAVKLAAEKTISGMVGIISTLATSKSGYLRKLIKVHASEVRVVNIGCPELENTVETGNLNSPEIIKLLTKYMRPIKKTDADIIVLGCTHYSFLKSQIQSIVGRSIKLVDSGEAIAKHTKTTLQRLNSLNKFDRVSREWTTPHSEKNKISFYTTGDSDLFSKVASSLLSMPVKAKHISLP